MKLNTSRSQHPKGQLLVLHEEEATALELQRRLGDAFAVYHADSFTAARRLLQRRRPELVLVSEDFARQTSVLRQLLNDFPQVRPMLIRSGAHDAAPSGISMDSLDLGDDVASAIGRVIGARSATRSEDAPSTQTDEPIARRDADQSELFGTAVHDLRNPLSVILGLSELMLQDEFSADEIQQFITAIKNNAGEMHRLLDDLQEVTRLDRGKARIRHAEVPIHRFLQETTDLARDSDDKPLPIDLDLTEAPDRWRFDSERMKRALLGLVTDNGSSGKATLAARTRDGSLEFVLELPGRNPSDEEIEALREGFRLGRRNRGLDEPGTGLGLALAARVAQAHGATLTVGRGIHGAIEFVMRLPQA